MLYQLTARRHGAIFRGYQTVRNSSGYPEAVGLQAASISRFCLQHSLPFEELCPRGQHAPQGRFGLLAGSKLLFTIDLDPEEQLEWDALAEGTKPKRVAGKLGRRRRAAALAAWRQKWEIGRLERQQGQGQVG